jgi:two-component system, NarL family, response regulator NreC
MKPFRILLAEDHTLFRELIKKNLGEIPDIQVVGEVSDGLELLKSVKILKPHMIILDIGLPSLSGIEAARTIKQTLPKIKILLLTMYKSKDHLKHALEAKVDGYLLKENAFNDLITAIQTIRQGELYISNILLQKMADFISKETWTTSQDDEDFLDNESDIQKETILTPKEEEVLRYFAQGKSYKNIAELLSINYLTARNYVIMVKKKLHIKNNIDLIKYAIKNGYTSIST